MPSCYTSNSFLEAKKSGADSITPDDVDVNSIDKHQTDEFVIPMPTFFKRRSLFETGVDPDTIQIDVLAEEKLCGSLSLTPEDLRMLVNKRTPLFRALRTSNGLFSPRTSRIYTVQPRHRWSLLMTVLRLSLNRRRNLICTILIRPRPSCTKHGPLERHKRTPCTTRKTNRSPNYHCICSGSTRWKSHMQRNAQVSNSEDKRLSEWSSPLFSDGTDGSASGNTEDGLRSPGHLQYWNTRKGDVALFDGNSSGDRRGHRASDEPLGQCRWACWNDQSNVRR